MSIAALLPVDWRAGRFLGRADLGEGPTPILIARGQVYDLTPVCPTVSLYPGGEVERGLGAIDEAEAFLAETALLSPVDLHCVKAAGVTFAVSAIERVIEERARGDSGAAVAIREKLEARVGSGIRSVVPGSDEAATLKQALIEEGLWSQYLEVAIGPDAEIFTKSPILSTVGAGAQIGIRSDSGWNNPEPEVVLVCGADGRAIGAALGNDVNLRDFEGRSALLLGKAKDNRASCAIGPMIRLFDDGFTMDDVRAAEVDLRIEGPEGYVLEGRSNMAQISRDPEELLRQAMSEHDYPDGFALFLGTLFAPIQDRDEPGRGFTHRIGDRVTISSRRLGTLTNIVTTSKAAAPWRFGVADLMRNLAARGLLARA
ncbi:fumarylacetoacetate hydrolase family protein [Sphingomonas naphthae]|uniref:Fumarylacetoacetate hydrolase family protein n=1 Tax=Sphingomonas naphthae TaxID=1813468 RepID=A0ABY7TIS8_9SPHN|nr:fumarylacetoacetate hydrolase family protein [Sphingomonas naphthae]WCT73100.1 fumarylacetoacetate hydrolase family protein [Sphingomonas naphthae]